MLMHLPDPDADLLPGLRAGQSEALSAMMDRHLDKIHALAYYMLGETMAAEDVAQESFIKLWQAAPNWREGEAKLLTWLRRVATNACLDRLRKKQPIYTDQLPEREDAADLAEANMIGDERAGAVREALMGLPPKQRAAITLSYYRHVPQRDGADILGVSEKAYESLLVRARRNLKTALLPAKEAEIL